MVYIPGGSFMMGQTDQDVTFAQIAQTKQVTDSSVFYGPNRNYQQPIQAVCFWVRDSIAITNYVTIINTTFSQKVAGANANNNNGKKLSTGIT
jgi:sulfatase modifying factor 1